jgi:hypothetical protein
MQLDQLKRREFISLLGGASRGRITGEKKSARRVSARSMQAAVGDTQHAKCAMVAAARSVS